MDSQIIVALIGMLAVVLGGSGLIQILITRHYTKHDLTKQLCKVNDRQGKELVVLSTAMESLLNVLELMVDALHEKNILNGNAKPIKTGINDARRSLHQYTKDMKDKGLFMGEQNG